MVGDIVVEVLLRSTADTELFGVFLASFMEARVADDAAFVMVHSDAHADGERKIVTFQDLPVAHAFRAGWDQALSAARSGLSS